MLLSARKPYAHDQRKEIDEASAMILSNFRQGEVDAPCRPCQIDRIEIAEYPASVWVLVLHHETWHMISDESLLAKAMTGSGLWWSLAPFVPLAK